LPTHSSNYGGGQPSPGHDIYASAVRIFKILNRIE